MNCIANAITKQIVMILKIQAIKSKMIEGITAQKCAYFDIEHDFSQSFISCFSTFFY